MTATPHGSRVLIKGTDLSLAQRRIQTGTRGFVFVSVLYGTSLHPRHAYSRGDPDFNITNP
jgi:hypothetical protein